MSSIVPKLRAVPLWVVPLALGVVVTLLPTLGLPYAQSRQVQLSLILALVVSGLNLSLGYAGELALGQAAMYAGGAYAAGILSVAGHTEILLQIAVASLAALVVGLLTGIPGLRLGGWSLAMASFFLVLLIPDLLSMFEDRTGGRNGLAGLMTPTLFGHLLQPDAMYVVTAVTTIVWFAVLRNLLLSRHGVAFRVLKQSPVLASSVGISPYRMKLAAYAIGSIPAGIAGALFANLDLFLSPESFGFSFATTVLAASILGGSASVYGAVVGALILQFALNQSSDFQDYSLMFTGAFLILGGVVLTGGLAAVARRAGRRLGLITPPPRSAEVSDLELSIDGARVQIRDLTKSFGGNRALRGVSLDASPGRVTALIGPNGSGKTTLLNMVSGFYRVDGGTIELDGRPLTGVSPDQVARRGVVRTFQTPLVAEGVSVLESVISGRYATRRASFLAAILRTGGFRTVRRDDVAEADRVLDLVGLSGVRDLAAQDLPLGQRRMLEVARCLIAEPKVLLLDEVASGLDELEIESLARTIARLRDAGATIVLIEHNFGLVLRLADDIYVLAHGEVVAHGGAAEIAENTRVRNEYLGITDSGDAPLGAEEVH